MSDLERMTVTLTPEMAALVRGAVGQGDYASSSEVIREALRDWRMKRLEQEQALSDMRGFIAEGLKDVSAGRTRDFDTEDIKASGRRRSRREG
jgi:antitoxin ParD1/3/4